MENTVIPRDVVVVDGEASRVTSDVEIESDYIGSEDLNSCASTDQ